MSSYNSITRSRQAPETPHRPSLGTRGTWPFQIEDDHPRLKTGTITYTNIAGFWSPLRTACASATTLRRFDYGYHNIRFRSDRRGHRRRVAFQNCRHDREEAPS